MKEKINLNKELILVSIIFIIGLAIRLSVAIFTQPDLEDLEIFSRWAKIFYRGDNVYEFVNEGIYSPLWIYFLYAFEKLSIILHINIYYIIRIFMVVIDSFNGLLIFNYSKKINYKNRFISFIAYAFNPAIILISSYHSNIDAFALFPLLIAINLNKNRNNWIWALATLSIFIKQITAFLFLTLLIYYSKSIKQFLIYFIGSCSLFLLSFLPFISAYENIIKHVFGHSGLSGFFGLTLFIPKEIVSIIFFIVMITIPILSKYLWSLKIHQALLFSSLGFIVFAPGFFGQYQLPALVFGSFFPNLFYLLFSTTGLIFLIDYYSFAHLFSLRHLLWYSSLLLIIFLIKNYFKINKHSI